MHALGKSELGDRIVRIEHAVDFRIDGGGLLWASRGQRGETERVDCIAAQLDLRNEFATVEDVSRLETLDGEIRFARAGMPGAADR